MGSPRNQDVVEAEEARQKMEGSFTKGMVEEDQRECRDGFCCLIFTLFTFVCIGISGYALATGKPEMMLTKYDSDGNQCGMADQTASSNSNPKTKRDFSEYKLKYWTNLESVADASNSASSNPRYAWAVCVKACPTKDQSTDVDCITNNDVTQCPGGITPSRKVKFNTQPVMGFCVPTYEELQTNGKAIFEKLNEMAGGAMTRYMIDVVEAWPVLLGMTFGALVITIVFLALLSYIMAPLIYLCLFLMLVGGVCSTAFCFMKWNEYPAESDDKNVALAFGCIAGIITLAYTCCICCLWSSLQVGMAVLKVTSRFVRDNKKLALGPCCTFVLAIPIVIWWLATSVYIYSIGEVSWKDGDMLAVVEQTDAATYMFWIFLFGFLWIVIFLIAIQQFTTAVAACEWYFTGQGSDIEGVKEEYSSVKGIRWAFKWYTGTLAYGSFLIAVVTMIKIVFEYCAKQAETLEQADQTSVIKCVLCCMRCCIWCVDCCIKFITENAYIQTALKGTSFCDSAQESFYMMIRNPGTYTATSTVGFLMSLLGKGFIVALTGFLTFVITEYAMAEIEKPIIVAVVGAIIGYFVASLFLQLFDFTSLAILQCYLCNKEAGGSINAPEELREFLGDWEKDEAAMLEAKRNAHNNKKANNMD